jgi:hypothetical protein
MIHLYTGEMAEKGGCCAGQEEEDAPTCRIHPFALYSGLIGSDAFSNE